MPDIDLGPESYRVKRRWRWPSLNTQTRLIILTVAIVALTYIFLHRDELSSASLFGAAALFSFGAGGMFTLLMDRH